MTLPSSDASTGVPEVLERPARAATSQEPRVTLRKAQLDDVDRVWEWSFAPELRAVMQSTRVILYKDYHRWFTGRLADRLTAMWIIEDAGANVGVLLIDRHDRQALPRLTIVLGTRFRGRGIGRLALEAACAQWQRPLIAEVDGANAAGVRTLEAAGFERTNERQAGKVVRCTYLWSP